MPEQDLTFGFNTKFFENAMNRMEKRMDNFRSTTASVAKGVTRGFTNITKKLLVVAGSIKGITKLFDQIPEIGKAFGIAKDIVFKNFLFPLRKAIFPMLQKFLDFIRDNRKTFVVWGQALANVFESVAGAMKELFAIGKQLGDFFISFINRTFGLQLKNFQDLINLTVFKTAVAIEFLKAAFPAIMEKAKPFIDLIAEGLGQAFTGVMSLVDGFISSISGIGEPLKSILETVVEIGAAFTSVDETGKSTNRIFKTIGETLGTIIKFVAQMTDAFLEGIKPAIIALEAPFNRIAEAFKKLFGDTTMINKWTEFFRFVGEAVGKSLTVGFEIIAGTVELITIAIDKLLSIFTSGPFQKFLDFTGEIGEKVGGFFSGALKGVKGFFEGPKVDDAIITKRGEVIKTNPQDNIFAFKEFPDMKAQGTSIGNINLDLTVNINESSGVPGAGKEIGMNIVDTIRQQLNTELVRIGAV